MARQQIAVLLLLAFASLARASAWPGLLCGCHERLPPPAPAHPPSHPSTPEPGELWVVVRGGGEVWLDGVSRGWVKPHGELDLGWLSPGRHVVRVGTSERVLEVAPASETMLLFEGGEEALPIEAPDTGNQGEDEEVANARYAVIDIQVRLDDRLRECFLAHKRATGELSSVTVLFTLEPDGRVSSGTVREAGLLGTPLEACLVEGFRELEFPSFEGPARTLSYPFRF